MKRKNGNKWERNRYHQLKRTPIEHFYYKSPYEFKDKGSYIKQLCHKALTNPEIDFINPTRKSYKANYGWVHYGIPKSYWDKPYYNNTSKVFNLKIKTKEEKRHLPLFMQHQIKDNRTKVNHESRENG